MPQLVDLGVAPKKPQLVDLGQADKLVDLGPSGPALVAGKEPSRIRQLVEKYIREPITEKTGLFPYVKKPMGGYDRSDRPFRTVGQAALYGGAKYGAGRALVIPPSVSEKVARKISGFEPTPKEKRISEVLRFMGGLKTAGKLVGPAVSRIPARMALKTILGSGLTFTTRKVAEELAEKVATGKPVDWEGIHFEGGIGTVFGAGEVGLRKLIGFMRGVKTFDQKVSASEHAVRARKAARAEINAALKSKVKNPAEWERVMRKYTGFGSAAEPRPTPTPIEKVKVKGFGKYPLAKAGEPVRIPARPIAKVPAEKPVPTKRPVSQMKRKIALLEEIKAIPKQPPAPKVPAEKVEPKPEEIAKRLGVPMKIIPKGLRAKAQYRKRTDDIAMRSHLPKGFDKDILIAHELGHRAHTKISNEEMDTFNKLAKEFGKDINKLVGRNINYFEEKGDYHGYFESFAELYGRYICGLSLPNEQFKSYFDEVAPLSQIPTKPAAAVTKPPAEIDVAKFTRQARIEEAMTKGEMGVIELEPGFQSTSKSVNEHIGYFENIQIPETSKIRPIQREIRRINGLRLAGKITAQEANRRVRALRTELFKTATGEGVSLRVTKGGKLSLAVRQAGTYVPAEFSKYTKFKDIAPLFGGGQDITRAVQQMDGALTVKQKVKTKGQAGPIERNVLWRTRDMSKQKIDFIKEQTIKLRKILKVRPNTKDDTLVNNVLREVKSGQSLKDAVKSPEVLKITTDQKIIRQAVELRQWYDDMINDQNALREMRNQDPIPFRRNYSPEIIRDATIWERVMMKDKRPREVIHGVELPDYVKPNKPFNPRELARDAGIRYEERVKSATQLARNYLVTASKDIFNTSIIQNNKAFIQQLETMGLEKSARYLADWTAEAYAGVKPALNRAMKLPKRLEKEARRFNQARNIAVFPLNISWNLTTQPSSLAFTFQKYGSWNTMRGFLDWMDPKIRKQVAKDYYSYIVKSTKHGRVTRQDVQNLIGETTTIKKTAGENLYDITTILIHEMEKVLTGMSIRAAYRHGKARGLTGKGLQEYASDGGGKTQSMYNDEDRPALLRSLAAKTLTPFQTFNYEVINNLREWAGRTGTPPSSRAERVMQLIRFLVAASIFRMIAKKVANKSIWTWDRIPIPFAEYWLSPIIKIWNKDYTGVPSLPSPVAVVVRIAKGIRDVVDVGIWRRLRRELLTYGTGYLNIPGGVQISRVVDGLLAYSKGGVYDRRGRLMFKVDPDEWDDAILFGIYSTRGGRKYLEKFKGKKPKTRPRRLDVAEQQMLRKRFK